MLDFAFLSASICFAYSFDSKVLEHEKTPAPQKGHILVFISLPFDFLQKQNRTLKLRCGKYSLEIKELQDEIADMKFTRKYLTAEDAGKAFARELLGKPMTREDPAIEAAEDRYVPYTAEDF